MNLEALRHKLLSAARAHPPADHVPYAFEKRILARLNSRPAPDLGALWARALWRAAAPCVAVSLLLGAWTLFTAQDSVAGEELSQDFEQAMLAVVGASEETW
ncbi:MAG: hypothetical protein KJ070_00030 [Verrucomicrobia bacterium]|nr:hypothetical protein [Verrucomicrobiota bacterium]